MAMKIAILEDNADRVTVMRSTLQDRFHQYEIRFFDDAKVMIEYLQKNWDDTILICLDHDLELKPGPAGKTIDPGTGRDVVEFLLQKSPACPVVIHSTNSAAALSMETSLREASWVTYRVVPFDDTNWIPSEWLKTTRRAILGTARTAQKETR